MFRPMAITVVSALFGSLLLALFVVPVLTTFALGVGVKEHREQAWFERLRRAYKQSLQFVLRYKRIAIGIALVAVVVSIGSLWFIGTEFMPRLDEGSILVQTRKLPGISLTDSIALSERVEEVLLTFPEVKSVVTKLGRPDLATEAMGIYEADVYDPQTTRSVDHRED
jgi:cobalt-zinc-cadmium resistance protein CzcA